MDHFEIKAELGRRGGSLTQIADAVGVSPCSVSLVVRGRRKSLRIAVAVARALGREVEQIWPGSYPKAPRIVAKGKRRHAA